MEEEQKLLLEDAELYFADRFNAVTKRNIFNVVFHIFSDVLIIFLPLYNKLFKRDEPRGIISYFLLKKDNNYKILWVQEKTIVKVLDVSSVVNQTGNMKKIKYEDYWYKVYNNVTHHKHRYLNL